MAASLIIRGEKYLDIGRLLAKQGYECWDLSPDFTEAVRCLSYDAVSSVTLRVEIDDLIAHRQLPPMNNGEWYVEPDQPPYRMGDDVAVVGTLIEA